jgi:asparagine synthase (glutamine-hydrolysing)
MCGILAYFGNSILVEDFKKSLNLMEHRGPDNTGIFLNDGVILGHKRLSIIDLKEASNQPFKIGPYIMIYNGEIYNYIELKREHSLSCETDSDTEVLLRMYIKYGANCLKYFNGMFSFIIYNTDSKKIFVARDRLGIKPLYVYQSSTEQIYSSEISSILSLRDSELDEFGMRQYRKLRMTLNGYTVYKSIKVFPAGHYMENGNISKYWDISVEDKEAPDYEEVNYLISDAVKIRKRADVPVGTYLSGGLDSTIITYLLKPDHTWTVGFDELNEFEWGKLAAKSLTSEHHEVLINSEEFIDTGKWMISKRREPLSVPNEILIYLMTKKVKRKNTVIISGEGADELFYGYDRIFKWANEAKALKLEEFDEKYCYGSNKDDEVLDFALENLPGKKILNKIAYFFQIKHLHGLLRRVDNSTMLCSVEARVPFVDHRLVELMAGSPFVWRMGNTFKDPLKKIYSNLIPNEIINRKKIGFPVPLESIFSNEINNEIKSMDAWLLFNITNLK